MDVWHCEVLIVICDCMLAGLGGWCNRMFVSRVGECIEESLLTQHFDLHFITLVIHHMLHNQTNEMTS